MSKINWKCLKSIKNALWGDLCLTLEDVVPQPSVDASAGKDAAGDLHSAAPALDQPTTEEGLRICKLNQILWTIINRSSATFPEIFQEFHSLLNSFAE